MRLETLERRQLLVATFGGWVSSYHNSLPDATADLVRHDALINFDWGQNSALDHVSPSDGFSAIWEGNLQSDHTATHELIVRTVPGDGVRVWVNDQAVIDAWAGAGSDELRGSVSLVAHQPAATKVEYRDVSGNAKIWLGWTSPQLPVEVIGPEWTSLSDDQRQAVDGAAARGVLFEQLSTVSGEFLSDGTVAPTAIASGSRLTSLVAAGSSESHPAQRLRGYLAPETSGNYQFRISGGTQSRLWIADDSTPELARLVASSTSPTAPGQWDVQTSQTSADVPLVAGVQYFVEARQTSSGAYGGMRVQWRDSDDGVWQDVPEGNLRPLRGEVGVRAVVSAVNETDASPTLSLDVWRSDDFGRDLLVDLNYGGTATRGSDYTGAQSTVTIPAGQRSTRVNVTVANDGVDEVLETIQVGVAPSLEYDLATPARTRTTLSIFGNQAPEGSSLIGEDPTLVNNVDYVVGIPRSALSNRTAVNENGGTVNGTVLSINTTSSSATVAVQWDVTQNITERETAYAEFYYRRVGGTSWNPFTFALQSKTSSATWGTTDLTATGIWQRAQIAFTPGESLQGDALLAELSLANRGVNVEIANFQVTRFVKSLATATSVLPADPVLVSNIDQRPGQNSLATFSNRTTTAGENVPFSDVLSVDVNQTGSFVTSVGARWNSDTAIETGALLTASVWLRSDDAPFDVRVEITQDSASSPLLRSNFQVNDQWQKFQFEMQADAGSGIGQAEIAVLFGRSLGLLEIGDIQLLNQGALPDLTQYLPQSYSSYAQRDADSDWRAAAEQSVLDNRRNELVVNVTNLSGVPVPGAVVEVVQQEHAYRFGNIIRTEYIAENLSSSSTDESLRHQAIASRLFNSLTIANGIRWVPWVNNELTGRNSVDWVNENIRDLHGHHLTWGHFDLIPSFVEDEYLRLQSVEGETAAVAYLRQAQLDHVAEIAAALGGTIDGTNRPKITSWDVANHPTLITQVWNILRQGGPLAGPIGEVFDVAAANAHPDSVLMVNEGQTIEAVDNPIRDQYFNLVQDLLAAGKPVEGIGFMNHFNFYEASSPTQLKTYLDHFATLGLPLLVTEFDIDATGTDLQTQTDWSEDYFLNVFSNPATTGIISYGFWEPAHWRSDVNAHWYDSNWEAKPNADVFVDQIHREWQTQTAGSTRNDGTYRTMAFNGTHDITVEVDGRIYPATATVSDSGGSITVVVDAINDVPAVNGLWLVNADSDEDIVALTDGMVIDLGTLPTTNLNVRTTTDVAVGSVGFELTGATTRSQSETIAPYALFGDASGDFNAGAFAIGRHTLVVTPYTGGGLTGAAGTAMTVSFEVVDSTNRPPVLELIGNKSVDEGVALTFTATATDPDNPANTLTFSLDAGAPAGASIDPVTGEFTWTPTEAQGPGTYNVTVRVTDDGTPNLDDFESIEIVVVPLLDYGDAPSREQSGLANDYPVTRAQDGARHAASELYLGKVIDTESDGRPEPNAGGDDDHGDADEDGVRVLTSMIAGLEPMRASLEVVSSQAGKLDGWIDFNRDGDWLDPDERLFTNSVDLDAGRDIVSFTIPAGASVGDTYARFRLSSSGSLQPTGKADDGEVEDYRLTIVDGTTSTDVFVDLAIGILVATAEDAHFVVRRDEMEVFRVPEDILSQVQFIGTGGNDEVGLANIMTDFGGAIPIAFDGGDGIDLLRLIDRDQTLDLTSGGPHQLQNLEQLDIVGASPNALIIDGQGVINATDANNRLVMVHDDDDAVTYQGDGWDVLAPFFVDGSQRHVLIHDNGARIETMNDQAFLNPLEPTDTNFNEETTSLDALLIINFISRFGGVTTVQLSTPTSERELPKHYYDVNASRTVTALDALLVINFLGRQANSIAPEQERPMLPLTMAKRSAADTRIDDERGELLSEAVHDAVLLDVVADIGKPVANELTILSANRDQEADGEADAEDIDWELSLE